MVDTPQETGAFGVACWRAWAPGLGEGSDWRQWISTGECPEPGAQPDVSYLPPLLRRRLDRSGRMALATAWPCAEERQSLRFVFGSRHGALSRTLDLFTALAKDETLSPTDFSLSVHNSAAGLWSISRGDRAAATAMGAGADTLVMSLLEGAVMIAEGAEAVLVCYSDDRAPAPFDGFVTAESSRLPFSVSLLLTPPDEAPLRCRLAQADEPPGEAPEAALMRFLTEDAPASVLGVNQPWRLMREAAHAH